MIVCVCHRVSDRDIEREVRHGCTSFEELQDETRVSTGCGRCHDCARDVFDVAMACRPTPAESLERRVFPIAVIVPAHPALPAPLAA